MIEWKNTDLILAQTSYTHPWWRRREFADWNCCCYLRMRPAPHVDLLTQGSSPRSQPKINTSGKTEPLFKGTIIHWNLKHHVFENETFILNPELKDVQ